MSLFKEESLADKRSRLLDTLTTIVAYYDSCRGVGHSSVVAKGANSHANTIIIAHKPNYLARLAPEADIVSSSHIRHGLSGKTHPLLIDNAVLRDLLADCVDVIVASTCHTERNE